MIILNNNNTNVNIPDYDDLVNKPSINGVVLEGNKTSQELKINFDTTNFYTKREVNERIADSITGIENEFGNYYTKSQSDSKYQPKGNYLTTIPSEYVTESELNGKNYATKSEIPTIPTNISSFNNDSGYITNSALTGYATETWVNSNYQLKGNYLTSIPSEYVTETELNDAIAGLGGSDIPYVVIEYKNAMTLTTISGDLQATLNAAKNKQPFLAYFYNTYPAYGKLKTLYPFTNVSVDESGFTLGYHTEVSATHKDIIANGSYDTTTGEYSLSNLGIITHSYATTTQLNSKQNTLVSGENIKTINGQSLLGSGNITIESETTIPTMFIPKGYSGSVDLSILTPIYDAVMNNKPWIVWGDLGAANGRYNMVECSTIGDNTITFYDNSVASDNSISIIRYWTFNITDGTFVMEERNIAFATTSYVDTQIGNINTILENIIG